MIKNTSKKYIFQETEVSVVFYNMSEYNRSPDAIKEPLWIRIGYYIISIVNLTRMHHCGIIFSRGNESIASVTPKTRRAKFIDENILHKIYYKPSKTINLGKAYVSLQQMNDYIKTPYVGNLPSVMLWYFITKPFLVFKPLQPKTCSLLISNMLRLCGYNVTDCVTPKRLHKELNKLCRS
tara:strand:- start:2435 stop:2974 length:540 start_codon:yes stop_codon:yes gene_type:complete